MAEQMLDAHILEHLNIAHETERNIRKVSSDGQTAQRKSIGGVGVYLPSSVNRPVGKPFSVLALGPYANERRPIVGASVFVPLL